METCKANNWAIVLVAIIATSVIILALFSPSKDHFMPIIEDMLVFELSMVVTILNLIGGTLILFGSVLAVSRYVLVKLKNPCKPFGDVAPQVTFLTLGLEIFIGAEIINTATTRTIDDFLLLSLTIATRGLIGLILYLEKRWMGHSKKNINIETEIE